MKTTICTYQRNFEKLTRRFPHARFGFEGRDVWFEIPMDEKEAQKYCKNKGIEIFEIDNQAI